MTRQKLFFNFMLCAFITLGADAAVVQRSTTASRSSISRAPTMSTKLASKTQTTQVDTDTANTNQSTESSDIVVSVTPQIDPIENKSSQFDTFLNAASTTNTDFGASSLAAMVRTQRAALDAASNIAPTTNAARANICDSALRSCMTDKCGRDFSKCSNDTDTIFGTKLDACYRNTNCTANEFKLLSAELKADRAQSIKLKNFNAILDCGTEYDTCIIEQCGTNYSKCLGKSDGDRAISQCASVANRCASMDNGLPNRAMNVFATLRQTAEKQVRTDEQKLYSLRDDMRSLCKGIGAMFDDRSLDCVYTVNFYAGDDATLYASKKAYAGSTFDCTPNWFGIDVTTFMDNAYRLTRAQSSASASMLGSGVGMAVGSLTSGAIDRAIDTKKAKNALKQAEATRPDYSDTIDDTPSKREQRLADRQERTTKNNKTQNTLVETPDITTQSDTESVSEPTPTDTDIKPGGIVEPPIEISTSAAPSVTVDDSVCQEIEEKPRPTDKDTWDAAARYIFGNKYCRPGNNPPQSSCSLNPPTIMCRWNSFKSGYNSTNTEHDAKQICDDAESYVIANRPGMKSTTGTSFAQTTVDKNTIADTKQSKSKSQQNCEFGNISRIVNMETDPEYKEIYNQTLQNYLTGTATETLKGYSNIIDVGTVKYDCEPGQKYADCMDKAYIAFISQSEAKQKFEEKLSAECKRL